MRDAIQLLERLSGEQLHQEALRARASQAMSDHQLAACLLVAERTGWARARGWGSVVQYGVKELELEAQKAADLLRAARLLEGLPLVSEAFRSGKLGWGKIRAMTRVVTRETERAWLEAALTCTTEELARQVALTPRDWKLRAQGQTTSAAELSLDFDASGENRFEPREPADGGAGRSEGQDAGRAGTVGASKTAGAADTITAGVHASAGPGQSCSGAGHSGNASGGVGPGNGDRTGKGEAGRADSTGASSGAGKAGRRGGEGKSGSGSGGPRAKGVPPLPLPGPRFIRVTLLLTPEQYAVYEKAQQRISSQRRRKVGREEATAEMARLTLDAAPERSRARHQVVVHVDASTELAWIETDRGLHVLTDDQRDDALAEGRVFLTTDGGDHPDRRREAGQSDRGREGRTEGEQSDRGRSAERVPPGQGVLDLDEGRSKRKKVRAELPLPTLRALFARARGRCERCSQAHGLEVHHCTPRSRGGTHELEQLKLLCDRCHWVGHDDDFAADPTWEGARAKARRRRRKAAG